MTNAAVIIAIVVTALLGMALVAASARDRQRFQLRARLHRVVDAPQSHLLPPRPQLDVGRSRTAAARYRFLPNWLAKRIERASLMAGSQTTPMRLLLVAAVSIVVVIVLGQQLSLSAPIILLAAAAASILVPYALVRILKGRYDSRFLAVFPDGLDLIVRAIKAGLPVSESLVGVGDEISDPVGKEFRRICAEIKIAVDLDESLSQAADRIQIVDFRFFVAALALQRQIGGNLAETLSSLSTTIRRRTEMKLKARALSAEGRISAIVLSLLPAAVSFLLYLVNPIYASMLFHDPRGHHMLFIAVVALIFGVLTMRWMIKRAVR